MKKIELLTIFLLCISFFATGQTNVKQDSVEASDTIWLTHSEIDYSIKYPEKWELNTSGEMGTSLILFSQLKNNSDTFRENVNLMKQNLTGLNLTLDKFVTLSQNQVTSMIENGKIISSERKNLGENVYQKVIFTGKQSGFNLKFEQYYWVIENSAYILTLTCDVNEFDNYQTVGEEILNSFNFNTN